LFLNKHAYTGAAWLS